MNAKKIAAVMAALTMMATTAFAEAPYTDIAGSSLKNAVDYLYDTNCLSFVGGNQFEPNAVLTRGDLAQLMYAVSSNLPLSTDDYSDIPKGRKGDAMAAVASSGILSGYQDGTFQPDELVTREDFAVVIYNYLKYNRMADADQVVEPYGDAAAIAPEHAQAIDVLHSKNIMVPENNQFRPKEGMTRGAAAEVVYRLLHSEGDYISHVQIESEVIHILNAEYGSSSAFLQQGTMYWDGDTLVLGVKGAPSRYLNRRLTHELSRPDAVKLRHVSLSYIDYDQLMNRAINALVDAEGVQNYIGAVPDYANEQIVLTVYKPVSDEVVKAIDKRAGAGRVRIETMEAQAQAAKEAVSGVATSEEKQGRDLSSRGIDSEGKVIYAAAVDSSTNQAIHHVQNDVMN